MVTHGSSDPGKGLGLGAFLAGFVPGLLQVQLGQTARAAVAFGSCTALFFVGWLVVGERLFYWALLEPHAGASGPIRGGAPFGFVLVLPELLNLPANALGAVLAFDGSPMGERAWRLPREFEHLAGWATAASGMLAAFWSAAGHWDLRLRRDGGQEPPRPVANPALCAALSWLVPGLGQAHAGQRDKGIVMGLAVVLVFAAGLWFSAGHGVDRVHYAVWWIGQNLFGGGSLFAALVTGPLRSEGAVANLDLGIVLCTVAGLMNLVVMIDAFTIAERSAFPLARPAEVTP